MVVDACELYESLKLSYCTTVGIIEYSKTWRIGIKHVFFGFWFPNR